MLDALEERADGFLEDTQELLLAVTEDDLPEVVLARMKGEKATGDAVWMLEKKVEKKLRNLVQNLAKVHGSFNGFDFDCTVGSQVLGLTLSNRNHFMFQWGKIRAGCHAGLSDAFSFNASTMKENLEFLGTCLIIEAKVDGFVNYCQFFCELKK